MLAPEVQLYDQLIMSVRIFDPSNYNCRNVLETVSGLFIPLVKPVKILLIVVCFIKINHDCSESVKIADCAEDNFKILDSVSTSFQLKTKEVVHILREQPSLNFQVKPLNLLLWY